MDILLAEAKMVVVVVVVVVLVVLVVVVRRAFARCWKADHIIFL